MPQAKVLCKILWLFGLKILKIFLLCIVFIKKIGLHSIPQQLNIMICIKALMALGNHTPTRG
jgi:hypothetical protein